MGIVRSGWRDILSFVAQGFGMRAASRNFFFYSTQLNANYLFQLRNLVACVTNTNSRERERERDYMLGKVKFIYDNDVALLPDLVAPVGPAQIDESGGGGGGWGGKGEGGGESAYLHVNERGGK